MTGIPDYPFQNEGYIHHPSQMPEIIKSLKRYVNHGIRCGDFLNAVLENDLIGALGKADHINQIRIYSICMYVYNEIPSNVWGSKKIVKNHIDKKEAGLSEEMEKCSTCGKYLNPPINKNGMYAKNPDKCYCESNTGGENE